MLLNPAITTTSAGDPASDQAARINARSQRAWGRFKLAAISSFAFVEAAGPLYVGKLLSDGLALKRHTAPNDPAPRPAESLDHETRLTMAASVLKAMSLTEEFARLVLLTGHGANVVNNLTQLNVVLNNNGRSAGALDCNLTQLGALRNIGY